MHSWKAVQTFGAVLTFASAVGMWITYYAGNKQLSTLVLCIGAVFVVTLCLGFLLLILSLMKLPKPPVREGGEVTPGDLRFAIGGCVVFGTAFSMMCFTAALGRADANAPIPPLMRVGCGLGGIVVAAVFFAIGRGAYRRLQEPRD